MAGKKLDAAVRAAWLRARAAWTRDRDTFASVMSLVDRKRSEGLYDVVRHSLYKESYVQMLRERPELREIVKSDDDRLCMHDMYEILSFRLGRKEPPPKTERAAVAIRGRIGRKVTTIR